MFVCFSFALNFKLIGALRGGLPKIDQKSDKSNNFRSSLFNFYRRMSDRERRAPLIFFFKFSHHAVVQNNDVGDAKFSTANLTYLTIEVSLKRKLKAQSSKAIYFFPVASRGNKFSCGDTMEIRFEDRKSVV